MKEVTTAAALSRGAADEAVVPFSSRAAQMPPERAKARFWPAGASTGCEYSPAATCSSLGGTAVRSMARRPPPPA